VFLGFLLLHIVLAPLMRQVHTVATLHALATLGVGLYLCMWSNRPLQIAQWAAYVVGIEVLWRMCKASIPWEFAKHSISFVCLVSLIRLKQFQSFRLPATYLVLLIPGALLPFLQLPLDEARKAVSFNLSGPVCLALCTIRFGGLKLTSPNFNKLGMLLLGPAAGIASVAIFRLATSDLDFSSNSNFAASGGYGPNQVSAILGLGAVLAVLLQLNENRSNFLRGAFAVLALWLLGQAALTFSRTGLYLFGAAFGAAAIFLLRWKGRGRRVLLVVVALCAGICAGLPMLDAFTGGKLTERFMDRGLTGRDSVALLDLEVFASKPIVGAGAGVSVYYRAAAGDDHAAHTEYTRLLADHGLLGAAALVTLLLMFAQALLVARGHWAKAVVAALAVWSLLFMTVSAMRLAAPAVLLGLVHARFLAGEKMPSMAMAMVSRRKLMAGPRLPGVATRPWLSVRNQNRR
jgi:hypothetical protein